MKQLSSYWFLWCYIIVMMIAPMIDKALNACEDMVEAIKITLPIMMLVFVWNFVASEASITLRTSFPAPTGFGSHTFLTLAGVYIAGRFTRKWLIGYIPTGWKLVAICVVLMVVVSIDTRLGRYDSPIALVVAGCWVTVFRNIKVAATIARIVHFITPSLFAVYLLHVSNVGNNALVWLDEKYAFVGYGGGRSMLVAVTVFAVCILLDMHRRFLVWGMHLMLRR